MEPIGQDVSRTCVAGTVGGLGWKDAGSEKLFVRVAKAVANLQVKDKQDQLIDEAKALEVVSVVIPAYPKYLPWRMSKKTLGTSFSILYVSAKIFYILTGRLFNHGAYSRVYDAIEVKRDDAEHISVHIRAEVRTRGWEGRGNPVVSSVCGAFISKKVNSRHVRGHGDWDFTYSKPMSGKFDGQSIFRVHLDQRHTMIMEKFEHDLYEVVKREKTYPTKTLLTIVCDAAEGLLTLHNKGYAHLDIKEENTLIKEGRGYLIDLDFALKVGQSPEEIRGTPLYQPPEFHLADTKQERLATLSPQADNWAFGIVLYKLFHPKHLEPPFLRDIAFHHQLAYVLKELSLGDLSKETLFSDWKAGPEEEHQMQALIKALLVKDPNQRASSQYAFDTLRSIEQNTPPSPGKEDEGNHEFAKCEFPG